MNHAYRRRGSKQGYTLRVQFPIVGPVAAEAISDGTVSYGVRRLADALKAEASFRTPKGYAYFS
jgi:hypothetical protein